MATLFHASMTFAKVFFFSEEIGDVFSMKVLAYSTASVAIVVVVLGLIMRLFSPRKKGEDDDTPMLMDTTTEGEKVETEQEVEVASTKEEK
ncbi:hypothetical protein ACX439_001560 [Staphylococcus pseudintermedius]